MRGETLGDTRAVAWSIDARRYSQCGTDAGAQALATVPLYLPLSDMRLYMSGVSSGATMRLELLGIQGKCSKKDRKDGHDSRTADLSRCHRGDKVKVRQHVEHTLQLRG